MNLLIRAIIVIILFFKFKAVVKLVEVGFFSVFSSYRLGFRRLDYLATLVIEKK